MIPWKWKQIVKMRGGRKAINLCISKKAQKYEHLLKCMSVGLSIFSTDSPTFLLPIIIISYGLKDKQ